MSNWKINQSILYGISNPLDNPLFRERLHQYLIPYCKGKRLVELGCGNGDLYHSLKSETKEWIPVDPYPPPNSTKKIVKLTAKDYLLSIKPNHLEMVLCPFSYHHFGDSIHEILLNRLGKQSSCLILSISRHSPWFNNDEWNHLFFSKGFESDIFQNLKGLVKHQKKMRYRKTYWTFQIPFSSYQMSIFIKSQGWSHLDNKYQIEQLLKGIPKDLNEIGLIITVREILKN